MYKQEKRLPKALYESTAWKFFKWFVSHAQLNIFCQMFMLQKWRLCWELVKSFYGVPYIVSIATLALGEVLPVPRKYKQYKKEHDKVEESGPEIASTPSGKRQSAGILPKAPAATQEELKRR